MKLAIHTATVAEELRSGRLDALQVARYAAQLGCRVLEVDPSWVGRASADTIRRAAGAAGLEVIYASDTRFPSEGNETNAPAEALKIAAGLGAQQMRVLLPQGTPRWEFLKVAATTGIRLLVENEPTPGSILHVRTFVDNADSPWVLALLDTAAPALVGEDPVRSLYLLNRRIGHVHLTDVKPLMGRLRATYPGDGILWWYGVVWALGALGYQEYLTAAFPGEGNGEACLRLAINHLTEVHATRFPARAVTTSLHSQKIGLPERSAE